MFGAPLLALAVIAAAPENKPDATIVLQERYPLAFLFSAPTGEAAKISSSETIRMISKLVEHHTDFFLQIAETQIVTDCAGRLACLVRQMRPDYNREAMLLDSGTIVPFSEHIRDLRQRKTSYPRYMIVLSNITLEGQADRVSAILIDTDIALEYFHSASREDPAWERDTDARINEYAVIFGPQRAQINNTNEAEKFIQDLFFLGLKPLLEQTNHWEPFGTIELSVNKSGVGILLDGAPIGTTHAGLTRIERVTSGIRQMSFEDPERGDENTAVEVIRNQVARVEVDLKGGVSGSAAGIRKGVFWTGLGLGVAGAVLTTVAIARSDSNVSTYCFDSPGANCRSMSQFQSIGYSASEAEKGGDPNPSGMLLAPLGYSIALTGITFALGTYLFGDSDEIPWIQLVAGVALGAASYGISSTMNP
jgi:hypothetical protein